MDYSLQGSSVHGISQARILEWGLPSPGDLPRSGIKPTFPALAGIFFTTEPPGKPHQGICLWAQNCFHKSSGNLAFSLSQWSLPEATWHGLLREIEWEDMRIQLLLSQTKLLKCKTVPLLFHFNCSFSLLNLKIFMVFDVLQFHIMSKHEFLSLYPA